MSYSTSSYRFLLQLLACAFIFICNQSVNSMEGWSIEKPRENFSRGISSLLNEEGYETVPTQIQEEKKYLCPKSSKRYTENSDDVSFETKQLIFNFLSLPDLVRENVVIFLGNHHSLAFFARLPGISNKTQCKSYKKLKYLHTHSMIKRYKQQLSDPRALLKEALCLVTLKNKSEAKHLYSDLARLNEQIKKPIDEATFDENLKNYVENTTLIQLKLKNISYYSLRIAFLTLLDLDVYQKVRNYDTCNDTCSFCLRYGLTCLLCSACSMFVPFTILSPTIFNVLFLSYSCIMCTAGAGFNCAANQYFATPEKKYIRKILPPQCCFVRLINAFEDGHFVKNRTNLFYLKSKDITAYADALELIQNAQKNLKDAKNTAALGMAGSKIN